MGPLSNTVFCNNHMVRKTFGIKEEEWEGKGWGEDKFFVHLKLKHMIWIRMTLLESLNIRDEGK